MTPKKIFLGILLGVSALVLAVALGLGFIHITEIPFKGCIDAFGIERISGLPRDEILANYRSVMHYLSPFYGGEFSLATLSFSESGAYHFYECKRIFNARYALGAIAAAVWAAAAVKLKKGRLPYGALGVSGCVTLLLPVVLCGAVAINFDAAFVLFHKIFFDNNMWLFDYRTDPVIAILPKGFFLACALVICAFLLAAAAIQIIAYYSIKRSREQ